METIWLRKCGNFLGGPVVNLPCNEGDVGLIPGQGAKIPQFHILHSNQDHMLHLPSPRALEPVCHNQSLCHNKRAHIMQQRSCARKLKPNAAK